MIPAAPEVVEESGPVQEDAGALVELRARVRGSEPMSWRWLRAGQEVGGDTCTFQLRGTC